MQPADRSGFEIAILCALTLEANAVDALFTEKWKEYGKQNGDQNIYTTGRIGQHNIVLAHMPGEGKTRGATVATSLRISFPRIRIALVVGICGVIPFNSGNEIVLGDIIISDGVVQYDLGKQNPDGFVRKNKIKDSLPRLGQELTGLLSKLAIPRNLKRLSQKTYEFLDKVQEECDIGYRYPGREHDRLFEGFHRHKHYPVQGNNCRICSKCEYNDDPVCDEAKDSICGDLGCHTVLEYLIPRGRLEDDDPKPAVHIGTIASGDTVMKSGDDRDEKARTLGAIAFEMEGAGVWDNLPCLVIKGACDYADSHKNDKFQCYAAATAAACAKAFLEEWHEATAQHSQGIRGNSFNKHEEECLGLLYKSTSDYEYDWKRTVDRTPGTCEWIIGNGLFKKWRSNKHSDFLWVSASPGSGKSYLASYLVGALPAAGVHVCYFFFKHDNSRRSASSALCAILHQLFRAQPSLIKYATPFSEDPKFVEDNKTLWKILTSSAADPDCNNIICIIDSLNECEDSSMKKLANDLQIFWKGCSSRSATKKALKFLVTSQPMGSIEIAFSRVPRLRLEDSMENREADIALVIDAGLPKLPNDLRNWIVRKAGSTFLWVSVVLEMIRTSQCETPQELVDLIRSVPDDLNDLYEKFLENNDNREDTIDILHIIVAAIRPLNLEELGIAHAIRPKHKSIQQLDESRVFPENFERYLKRLCGVFIRIVNSKVSLVHETAKIFLVSKSGPIDPSSKTWKNSLDQGRSHFVLAERCMLYILLPDFDDCDWRSLLGDLTKTIHPEYGFLQYASHWLVHWRQSEFEVGRGQGHLELALRILNSDSKRLRQAWYPYKLISRNFTPLIMASLLRIEPLVQGLVESGARLAERDDMGRTALHWAAFCGYFKITHLLLAGVPIDTERREREDGHETTVELVDAKDLGGSTPLQLAADHESKAIVRMPLDTGEVSTRSMSLINFKDRFRKTALLYAAEKGYDKVVEQLLAREDIDPDCRDGNGGTPLSIAARNGHKKIIERLLSREDVDPNSKNNNGWTPLFYAVEGSDTEAAEMLLARDSVDPNIQNLDGETVLHVALGVIGVTGREREMLKFLLARDDINLNPRNNDGETPLLKAVNSPSAGPVELLVAKDGVDVNARYIKGKNAGETALYCAVTWMDKRIVELLLAKDEVDVNATCDGETALELAESFGDECKEIFELLKAKVDSTR